MNSAFKALSDKTRRQILQLLKDGDMTAGDIASHFNISKPSISHHLAVLKNAGMVTDIKEGQNVIYSINLTVFNEMLTWFLDISQNKEEKK